MRTIPLDDLEVGEWITVLEVVPGTDGPVTITTGEEVDEAQRLLNPQQKYEALPPVPPGVPVKIIGVNLPFVYGSGMTGDGVMTGPKIFDVRKVRLIKLNPEVPQAIMDLAEVQEEQEHQEDGEGEPPAVGMTSPAQAKSATDDN